MFSLTAQIGSALGNFSGSIYKMAVPRPPFAHFDDDADPNESPLAPGTVHDYQQIQSNKAEQTGKLKQRHNNRTEARIAKLKQLQDRRARQCAGSRRPEPKKRHRLRSEKSALGQGVRRGDLGGLEQWDDGRTAVHAHPPLVPAFRRRQAGPPSVRGNPLPSNNLNMGLPCAPPMRPLLGT